MKGGWIWSLPPKVANSSEDAQRSDVAAFGKIGHLREREREYDIADSEPLSFHYPSGSYPD
jgi:hypothetical protein